MQSQCLVLAVVPVGRCCFITSQQCIVMAAVWRTSFPD